MKLKGEIGILKSLNSYKYVRNKLKLNLIWSLKGWQTTSKNKMV